MEHFMPFKNAQINYTDAGVGPVIVLLHGFLENNSMWTEIIPEISKRNRVITLDLLGHGKSDCIGYVHSMELMAAAVETVLKKLRIRKCVLVGHSMGGYVALAFAEKNSNKIKGLCLLNSTSNSDTKELKIRRERANKMVQTNFEELVKISFVFLFDPESKKKFKKEVDDALQEALKTPIQGYIAANEGMRLRPNRNHVLSENSFKKLIIVGQKDPVLNYEKSLEEAAKTDSEILVLPDGHMSHIENTEELIRSLKAFIKAC